MSEQDPPNDLPDLLLPSILEDPYPDPMEDELKEEATPTSALTAEADQSWQPSTTDESALRRELAEVDALGPVSKAELRSLTGRIFDSLKDGVSYLSPFKPSPLYVEPTQAFNQEWTKVVKQEPTKHLPSSQKLPSDPPECFYQVQKPLLRRFYDQVRFHDQVRSFSNIQATFPYRKHDGFGNLRPKA
jgi:hypothetical protein